MLDLGLIALTVFLFGLMFALVAWFDRIWASQISSSSSSQWRCLPTWSTCWSGRRNS